MATETNSCCGGGGENPPDGARRRIDWLLWVSAVVIMAAWLARFFFAEAIEAIPFLGPFCAGAFDLFNKMWWGILIGIAAVGFLAKVPREFVISVLGKGGSFGGILRATGSGVLLDLCSHGILMVGSCTVAGPASVR